jgi:anti-sigma factor RsiW
VTGAHIEDLAELYALGALDDGQRAAIEAHLETCPACARLVGSAERDVALIASMETRREPPRELNERIVRIIAPRRAAWPLVAALAAAFVLGLLPALYLFTENRALHDAMLAQGAAMQRLAAAPHRMANFRPAQAGPAAEVVYGTDGSWYLVVVHGAAKTLGVAWMHDGERTMLGRAIPRGNLAMLYLPKSHRMDRLALMDGDRIVAEATLSWQRTAPNRQGARSG